MTKGRPRLRGLEAEKVRINETTQKYFQSEKGKTALALTQKKYYRNKKKPERELVKAYSLWSETHPGEPVEAFLAKYEIK